MQVRVGDYAFDSSRFVTQDRGAARGRARARRMPLDDNYDAIRREIWLATDTAYKRAVSVFAKKKAAFQNRAATDQIPDFSRETPVADRRCRSRRRRPSDREWVDRAQAALRRVRAGTRTSIRPRSGSPKRTARASI